MYTLYTNTYWRPPSPPVQLDFFAIEENSINTPEFVPTSTSEQQKKNEKKGI